jgi:hypothetical protein
MEFGEVVSVKIVYDRESGESRGFGFVTFTNPRSAMHAIRDMDGGQIEGRTVRVNEVRKNKGFAPGTFRDRGGDMMIRGGLMSETHINSIRGEFRDREPFRRRRMTPPSRDRAHRTRSPPLQRNNNAHRSRSPILRGSSPVSSPVGTRYQSPSEAKERSRSGRSSVSPVSSEEANNNNNNNNGETHRKEESVHKGGSLGKLSSRVAGSELKEEDTLRQLRDELEKARENRKELEDKVASLKEVVEKADVTIAALQTKSEKLEESLAAAQKMATQRQQQLRRLQTGVFHFKLCTERLSNSEREMKALAALTTLEIEHEPNSKDAGAGGGIGINGHTDGNDQNHVSELEHYMTTWGHTKSFHGEASTEEEEEYDDDDDDDDCWWL